MIQWLRLFVLAYIFFISTLSYGLESARIIIIKKAPVEATDIIDRLSDLEPLWSTQVIRASERQIILEVNAHDLDGQQILHQLKRHFEEDPNIVHIEQDVILRTQ